ncbi:LAME_0G08262g1_1 [Lachancea meyersii CBS 8951]|uniref:LAME_0G08262g1_1 n=1 Tax=Lachancea meyersii CBS 8951 TaxID=1266667 RepID=A0A1G4K8A7_9SACH|nr:LAME_0G08262g1_1 [Lachancea meyersii CBS 8951]
MLTSWVNSWWKPSQNQHFRGHRGMNDVSSVWESIREEQESAVDAVDAVSDSFDGYDDDDDLESLSSLDYHENLLSAQQQWQESLEQLSQVFNWVLLPLVGKYLGRRTALAAWKRVLQYVWRTS